MGGESQYGGEKSSFPPSWSCCQSNRMKHQQKKVLFDNAGYFLATLVYIVGFGACEEPCHRVTASALSLPGALHMHSLGLLNVAMLEQLMAVSDWVRACCVTAVVCVCSSLLCHSLSISPYK